MKRILPLTRASSRAGHTDTDGRYRPDPSAAATYPCQPSTSWCNCTLPRLGFHLGVLIALALTVAVTTGQTSTPDFYPSAATHPLLTNSSGWPLSVADHDPNLPATPLVPIDETTSCDPDRILIDRIDGPEGIATSRSTLLKTRQRILTYEVKAGDTMQTLAERFGITPGTIIAANELSDPNNLAVGQKLIILPVSGILHRVQRGDTLLSVAEKYMVDPLAIVSANRWLRDPFYLTPGRRLIVPGAAKGEDNPGDTTVRATRAMPSSRGATFERSNRAPLTPQQEQFLAQAIGPAQASQRETGVPASVTLAQAILESNWGTSALSQKANNFFGIKARERGGTAGVVWMPTGEYLGGRYVVIQEPFRAYNNMLDSFLDHGRYLRDNRRYAEAMRHKDDPKAFARLIHQAGYATDPAYSEKLIGLMDRLNLYAYDLPPGS